LCLMGSNPIGCATLGVYWWVLWEKNFLVGNCVRVSYLVGSMWVSPGMWVYAWSVLMICWSVCSAVAA